MKRWLSIAIVFFVNSMMPIENDQGPVVSEPNVIVREQQYWQDLFNAIQEFKKNAKTSPSAYLKELTELAPLISTALIDAALVQVLAHALYVLELRTQEQFSNDLRKALMNLQQDDDFKKELLRLTRMNLDPLWFLGKKTTVEQMAGMVGQDLVRAAAVNQIVLKQAERVKKMVEHQVLELEEQKRTATLKPLVDTRLMQFKTIESYLTMVINECQNSYDAILTQAQQKINNQAFLQYLQNIGKSIRYIPDQGHIEYMETIGNIAQAIYPSVAYRKYMAK